VEAGSRFIVAVWFTLSAAHAEPAMHPAAIPPSHPTVRSVPPPSIPCWRGSMGVRLRGCCRCCEVQADGAADEGGAGEGLHALQAAVDARLAQLTAELGADAPRAAALLERLALQRSR
jgi:hypothetical protein